MSLLSRFNDMGHLHLKWFPDHHPGLSKSARTRTACDAEVGYATRKATCKHCQADVARGAPRATLYLQCHRGYKNKAHFHVGCVWQYDEALRVDSADELSGLSKLEPADQRAVRDGFAALQLQRAARTREVDAEVLRPPTDPTVPTPGSCLESVVHAVVALAASGAAATESAIRTWLRDNGHAYGDVVMGRALTGGLRRAVLTQSSSGSFAVSRAAAAHVAGAGGASGTSHAAKLAPTRGSARSRGRGHSRGRGTRRLAPAVKVEGSGVPVLSTGNGLADVVGLVAQAVRSLKANGGSSAADIERWVCANTSIPVSRRALRSAVRSAVRDGALAQHHAKIPTYRLASGV